MGSKASFQGESLNAIQKKAVALNTCRQTKCCDDRTASTMDTMITEFDSGINDPGLRTPVGGSDHEAVQFICREEVLGPWKMTKVV